MSMVEVVDFSTVASCLEVLLQVSFKVEPLPILTVSEGWLVGGKSY
jgi:hypothetical protein